ncbi:hypothetical protein [Cupriavidus sp.]|nr:hypothetical protein [Cupriavidus sp.]MCA3187579.1 hypothetical protein [Cupriavidus sp.]MCA3190949.1 hypothetical protein [Cupriavidus sp.]MCA3199293.1 hypothetical protein [Cupriavidus sp.]MCA3204560.1 hypothetical protein [Cupriavidus sp.]MCA3207741.1 hypothetical protein [Cupriavidus sp.]
MTYDPDSNQLLPLAKRKRSIEYACAAGFVIAAPLVWYLAVALRAGAL